MPPTRRSQQQQLDYGVVVREVIPVDDAARGVKIQMPLTIPPS